MGLSLLFGTGFGGDFAGITDLKVGPDGRLYILSLQDKIFAVSQKPATLHGMVSDQTTGAVLEGASVAAWHADPTPVTRDNTDTDAAGLYTLSELSPDRYWVFFGCNGYQRRARILELPPGEGPHWMYSSCPDESVPLLPCNEDGRLDHALSPLPYPSPGGGFAQ